MEECQRCKVVDEDRRTLRMSCFYEMDELHMPFKHEVIEQGDWKQKFYTLRVCKECRAFWMGMIKVWFNLPIQEEQSCGSGIFVRELGGITEITEEEWKRRHPDIEPARFKSEE